MFPTSISTDQPCGWTRSFIVSGACAPGKRAQGLGPCNSPPGYAVDHSHPSVPRVAPRRSWVQDAFKNSMIHGYLRFALRFAFRCVLHRCGSRDIHCWKSCNYPLVSLFRLPFRFGMVPCEGFSRPLPVPSHSSPSFPFVLSFSPNPNPISGRQKGVLRSDRSFRLVLNDWFVGWVCSNPTPSPAVRLLAARIKEGQRISLFDPFVLAFPCHLFRGPFNRFLCPPTEFTCSPFPIPSLGDERDTEDHSEGWLRN